MGRSASAQVESAKSTKAKRRGTMSMAQDPLIREKLRIIEDKKKSILTDEDYPKTKDVM